MRPRAHSSLPESCFLAILPQGGLVSPLVSFVSSSPGGILCVGLERVGGPRNGRLLGDGEHPGGEHCLEGWVLPNAGVLRCTARPRHPRQGLPPHSTLRGPMVQSFMSEWRPGRLAPSLEPRLLMVLCDQQFLPSGMGDRCIGDIHLPFNIAWLSPHTPSFRRNPSREALRTRRGTGNPVGVSHTPSFGRNTPRER